MLLNIDRVLTYLSEGKDIKKIAEMAKVEPADVVNIITEARELLSKHEGERSRRKITIQKKSTYERTSNGIDEILRTGEISAVRVEDSLILYVAVKSKLIHSTAGVFINDGEDRQVGRLHYNINEKNEIKALYMAMTDAVKVAKFFKSKSVRVKFDNEYLNNQLEGKTKCAPDVEKLREALMQESKNIRCSFELIHEQTNDKAQSIAAKRVKPKRTVKG
jgi:hypothetical protein